MGEEAINEGGPNSGTDEDSDYRSLLSTLALGVEPPPVIVRVYEGPHQ